MPRSIPSLGLDVDAVMAGKVGRRRRRRLHPRASGRGAARLFLCSRPTKVAALQKRAWPRAASAEALEQLFAETAQGLVDAGVRRLVVAGGETSGAVVSALGLGALRIGPEIDPGVPALSSNGQTARARPQVRQFRRAGFLRQGARAVGGGAMSEATAARGDGGFARSLFERGLSVGSAGNICARGRGRPADHADQFLPRLPRPGPDLQARPRRARMSPATRLQGGVPAPCLLRDAAAGRAPSSICTRPMPTALSCLPDVDPEDCIPPITPYVVMRVGRVQLVPYLRPGDPRSGELIRGLGGQPCGRPPRQSRPGRRGEDLAAARSSPPRSWRRRRSSSSP